MTDTTVLSDETMALWLHTVGSATLSDLAFDRAIDASQRLRRLSRFAIRVRYAMERNEGYPADLIGDLKSALEELDKAGDPHD